MRKTFIKVEYTARRGEPYKLTHVEHYTQRQEERVNQVNEDDLIDIDDTLQISALRKVSTYTYIIILAFKENHNLFNILTLSDGMMSGMIIHPIKRLFRKSQAFWPYVYNMTDLMAATIRKAFTVIQNEN